MRISLCVLLVSIAAVTALDGRGGGSRSMAYPGLDGGQASQQPSEVELRITGEPGTPPRLAVPDFVALSPESAEVARTLGAVLWDDFNFEREFYLIPRDTYASIRAARTPDDIPFTDWRELGADAIVFGTVQRSGDNVTVQVRLFNVRTRQSVFSKEYTGPARNPRVFAHTFADEAHEQQRALPRGVARTRLTFSSDRDRERISGPVGSREIKEIWIADYDGANQRRITSSRQLNTNPTWSPDTRAVAYTSWRKITPDIFVSLIYQGVLENPSKGQGSNFMPVYSPDGSRIAFVSTRAGNMEIFVMNADGSNARQLTNHPAYDVTPTWSPTGAQIAFTSDRSGKAQIYVMNADGSGLRRLTTAESEADRATWSPAPFNEVAFSARTGSGYDLKVYELSTGQTRQLTFGEGSNESPAYAPSGRHLAFTSTRSGRAQVYTIGRDGRGLRQITRDGSNFTPSWSN